jgi:hypothetical protein
MAKYDRQLFVLFLPGGVQLLKADDGQMHLVH